MTSISPTEYIVAIRMGYRDLLTRLIEPPYDDLEAMKDLGLEALRWDVPSPFGERTPAWARAELARFDAVAPRPTVIDGELASIAITAG